jgi:toxin FitB
VIVVDTNVVSELMKAEPDDAVRRWALDQPGTELATTSITVAEILYGIERLPVGRRTEALRSRATDVFRSFADKVLPFDQGAAGHYARIVDDRDRMGRPIDGFDAQIAAICRSGHHTLATRNTRDYSNADIALVDPWTSG